MGRVKSVAKRHNSFKFMYKAPPNKKDNKCNISSNRMTIVPGFLNYGVKSELAKKEQREENRNHNIILQEDLHSLFRKNSHVSPTIRRSQRISQQGLVKYKESPKNRRYTRSRTSNKFLRDSEDSTKLKDTIFPAVQISTPFYQNKNPPKYSKSLFRKIISSQTVSNSSNFDKPINRCVVKKGFNENLLDRIHIHLKVDIIQDLRNKIYEELNKVNDILTGKSNPTETMGSIKKIIYENSDTGNELPEFLFPSDEWLYATPPSQKLNMSLYEESAIQPAIFCNDGIGRNIYELKKNIDANLINHINPEKIEVDQRYMEQIAEFDKDSRPLREFPWQDEEQKFNFRPKNMNKCLLDHLTTIHARPKKTVKRLRFADNLSKNELLRDRCRPSTSALPDGLPTDSPGLDFTFVNCLTDNSSFDSPQSRYKLVRRKLNIFKHLNGNKENTNPLNISDDE